VVILVPVPIIEVLGRIALLLLAPRYNILLIPASGRRFPLTFWKRLLLPPGFPLVSDLTGNGPFIVLIILADPPKDRAFPS